MRIVDMLFRFFWPKLNVSPVCQEKLGREFDHCPSYTRAKEDVRDRREDVRDRREGVHDRREGKPSVERPAGPQRPSGERPGGHRPSAPKPGAGPRGRK